MRTCVIALACGTSQMYKYLCVVISMNLFVCLFVLQYFVIKRCKGVFSPQTFYDSLPKEKKNDFFVRCYRVVHLLQEKVLTTIINEFELLF